MKSFLLFLLFLLEGGMLYGQLSVFKELSGYKGLPYYTPSYGIYVLKNDHTIEIYDTLFHMEQSISTPRSFSNVNLVSKNLFSDSGGYDFVLNTAMVQGSSLLYNEYGHLLFQFGDYLPVYVVNNMLVAYKQLQDHPQGHFDIRVYAIQPEYSDFSVVNDFLDYDTFPYCIDNSTDLYLTKDSRMDIYDESFNLRQSIRDLPSFSFISLVSKNVFTSSGKYEFVIRSAQYPYQYTLLNEDKDVLVDFGEYMPVIPIVNGRLLTFKTYYINGQKRYDARIYSLDSGISIYKEFNSYLGQPVPVANSSDVCFAKSSTTIEVYDELFNLKKKITDLPAFDYLPLISKNLFTLSDSYEILLKLEGYSDRYKLFYDDKRLVYDFNGYFPSYFLNGKFIAYKSFQKNAAYTYDVMIFSLPEQNHQVVKSIRQFTDRNTSVYPNPASEVIHVGFPASSVSQQLMISDLNGRIIHSIPIDANQHSVIINVSGYPSGIYLYNVSNVSGKFIVK